MLAFCILGGLGGYILTALSLYLVWGLKLEGLALLVPLMTQTLAVFLWGTMFATSVWMALSVKRGGQEMWVYWMNALLAGLPFGYFAYSFYVFPGARTQFVLEWLTRDCFKLLY